MSPDVETSRRQSSAGALPPDVEEGDRPTLVLGISDIADLRHLSHLRRCVRAELADLPPSVRDDVALVTTELVVEAIRRDRRCRRLRVVRLRDRVRVEVDAGAERVVLASTTTDGLEVVGGVATVEVLASGDGVVVRGDVDLTPATGAPGRRDRRGNFPRPLRVRPASPSPLAARLEAALLSGGPALEQMGAATALDEHDRLVSLSHLHALHVAPVDVVGPAVRFQHHPALAALKWRLESEVLDDIEAGCAASADHVPDEDADRADPVGALRAVAARDLVPSVYRWVADRAALPELVEFLALEGGPDAGFDDLVAACQIGLVGEPKLELARNYWDEMGRGDLEAVHTVLHDRLVAALAMPRVPLAEQPAAGLLRSVLGTLLVTNRWLQPELVGALGLLELQAGPRCRHVVRGLRRVDAPPDALPFYEEHAEVDPHHGKAWLDHAIAPLGADPAWAVRMVRGARWRSLVNRRFFDAMHERFVSSAGPMSHAVG
jgi:hypothetical protein